ncbi:valine--tRNA ligase [Sphingosinicella soli]|uniref:Valine--tRNA ligase n=1 Tax=Sphingosinicella soli TaxID=333708 RepID=A0A7W7B453_9SPHN|nr:valine--tRNA ligase [Sphingosinicella soli]MBB4633688.1 valyl-tRNA synthetase [Sphingosinicella soli]
MTIEKTFAPGEIETRWYKYWEENGKFRPDRPDAEPFTIVNPPPNVTGSLHIGHALDNTLQDIVVRYERLRGKDALWVVGTDHAGIATQMVVERQLEAQQDKRTNYSREDFIAKVWDWKAESGGQITRQLRRLGCSMDWSREQFTMDPHFTRAVVKVFVELYNQGLIYRDKRLVNWDPKLKTAISDLEVETREVKGHFWRFKYPLADGATLDDGRDYIEVATTRPETMLADMAVAVHPEDARYRSVIGKRVKLPLTGRLVPIVADEHADPELGSGAVKITPGHDFNDFEVGKRAGIKAADMLNMFDAEAKVVQTADGRIPTEYLGLDRFDARALVVEQLKGLGFLIPHVSKDKDGEETQHDAEPRTIQTPYGDRGGVVIEPWLTDQWYVNAEELAKKPIEAVRSGAIEIIPKTWEKTFFNWMENIQPWCVSRQLWWGHRIPAWFGPHTNNGALVPSFDTQWIVANDEKELFEKAREAYGDREIVIATREEAASYASNIDQGKVLLWRDGDVLDTWFSSALWPFATLGWPAENLHPSSSGEGPGVGALHTQPASRLDGPTPTPPLKERGSGTRLFERHYPNDLCISGFDILFFWDARMAMQGMHFMGDVPWKRLYLHGLVRAADGQKMSKSKGNVVDPLGLIDQYGADALRFFMAAMESQGRDVKMDERRVEGYRNFATKLWNAARFCQSNGIAASRTIAAPAASLAVNRWIIAEVAATAQALETAMAEMRFDAYADAIYQFTWSRFCDWYLELIKPILSSVSPGEAGADATGGMGSGLRRNDEQDETMAVAGWALDQILVMLHPVMPFVTEELWHALGDRGGHDLITAKWVDVGAVDASASAEIDWLIRLVSEIRSARTALNVPPGARMEAYIAGAAEERQLMIKANWPTITKLARIDWSDGDQSKIGKGNTFQVVVDEVTFALQLEGVIDIAAERVRLEKNAAAAEKERDSLAGRLGNPAFVDKAKPEAVEKARADHAEKSAEAERLRAALARLG